MLTASVSGEIFASPSTSQMLSALEAVPSKRGQIIVAINYTGDCLNFGLATEKANAMGKSQCGMLVCGDDVSVGRKGELVGRRGLAGQLCVLKIMGAASGSGESFEALMGLGSALCDQIVSIAATLEYVSSRISFLLCVMFANAAIEVTATCQGGQSMLRLQRTKLSWVPALTTSQDSRRFRPFPRLLNSYPLF